MLVLTKTLKRLSAAIHVDGVSYDLVIKRAEDVFYLMVHGSNNYISFHENEIMNQLGIDEPKADDVIKFMHEIYAAGLNINRKRDHEIKLLVEGMAASSITI